MIILLFPISVGINRLKTHIIGKHNINTINAPIKLLMDGNRGKSNKCTPNIVNVLFDKYVITENVFLYINDEMLKITYAPNIDVNKNNTINRPNSKFNHDGLPLYNAIKHKRINATVINKTVNQIFV